MRKTCALLASLAIVVGGCGKTESKPEVVLPTPEPKTSASSTETKSTTVSDAPTPTAKPTTPAPTTTPVVADPLKPPKEWPRPTRVKPEAVLTADTPEGVVEQVSKALADGKYQVLWEMLPESHQKDLQGVLLEFTNRMDPALYDHIVAIVEFTTRMVEKQKERLLKHPVVLEFGIESEKLSTAMDGGIVIGKALLDSELYSLAELQGVDIPTFLATTGPKIVSALPALAAAIPAEQAAMLGPVEQAFGIAGSLKSVKATRVSGDDNATVIRVEVEGQDPTEVEFVKVEGKWIPKQLQESWPTILDQFRQMIAMVPDKTNKEAVAKVIGYMPLVWGSIQNLNNMETDEKFNKQLNIVVGLLRSFKVLPGGRDKTAPKPPEPPMP